MVTWFCFNGEHNYFDAYCRQWLPYYDTGYPIFRQTQTLGSGYDIKIADSCGRSCMPKYCTLDLTHLQIYIHLAWKRLGTIANYCELIFLLSCNYKHRLTFSTVLSLRLRKEHYHIDMAPTVHLTDSGRDLEQQQAHANHSHANLHDSTSVHQHAVFWNIPCCLADTFTLHTLLSFTMHMVVSNPSGYPPNHPFVF